MIFEEDSLDNNDIKLDQLILEGHTLPCLQSDGFCKPTQRHPLDFAWLPEEKCLMFQNSDLIGWLYKMINRYWSKTDDFVTSTGNITEKNNKCILLTVFFYTNSPVGAPTPTLSGLEIIKTKKITFFIKQTQMH